MPAAAGPADPVPIRHTDPKYPRGAQARGIQGWVLVEFTVDGKGNVVTPKIVEGSPPGVFDASALAAVTNWKYEATGTDTSAVQIKFIFKVTDGN